MVLLITPQPQVELPSSVQENSILTTDFGKNFLTPYVQSSEETEKLRATAFKASMEATKFQRLSTSQEKRISQQTEEISSIKTQIAECQLEIKSLRAQLDQTTDLNDLEVLKNKDLCRSLEASKQRLATLQVRLAKAALLNVYYKKLQGLEKEVYELDLSEEKKKITKGDYCSAITFVVTLVSPASVAIVLGLAYVAISFLSSIWNASGENRKMLDKKISDIRQHLNTLGKTERIEDIARELSSFLNRSATPQNSSILSANIAAVVPHSF